MLALRAKHSDRTTIRLCVFELKCSSGATINGFRATPWFHRGSGVAPDTTLTSPVNCSSKRFIPKDWRLYTTEAVLLCYLLRVTPSVNPLITWTDDELNLKHSFVEHALLHSLYLLSQINWTKGALRKRCLTVSKDSNCGLERDGKQAKLAWDPDASRLTPNKRHLSATRTNNGEHMSWWGTTLLTAWSRKPAERT